MQAGNDKATGMATSDGTSIDLVGKTATQSSLANMGDPERAVDDNNDGVYALVGGTCSHTNSEMSPWWMVDMGDSNCVGRVEIFNRIAATITNKGAVVRVGPNSDRNNPVCGAALTVEHPEADQRSDVTCNLIGRYLSIDIQNQQEALVLCEVRAYTGHCIAEFSMDVPSYIAKEGDTEFDVTVHRRGYLRNTDQITLSAIDGTATYGTDYSSTMGQVINLEFAADDKMKTVRYVIAPDKDVEDTESFTLSFTLDGTTAASDHTERVAPYSATVFMLDCSFLIWIDSIYFGEEGASVDVIVHRGGFLGNADDKVEISASTTSSTADSADFTAIATPNNMITFDKGSEVKEYAIALKADDTLEGTENFVVEISNLDGINKANGAILGTLYKATIYILDLSSIYWIDSMYVGAEGSAVKIYVHRAGYLGQDTSIELSLVPQTATAANDYVNPGNSIDFDDGKVIGEIDVTLKTDALVEGIEYFRAELGAVTGATPGSSTVDAGLMTANIFILDHTSYFWIEEKQYSALEGTPNLEVTFHRGGYLGRTDTIMVTYTDARALDGVDYTHSDDSVTFGDNVTAVTKEIDILPDNVLEYNEMFYLGIRIPSGTTLLATARIGSPATSEIIIKDRQIIFLITFFVLI